MVEGPPVMQELAIDELVPRTRGEAGVGKEKDLHNTLEGRTRTEMGILTRMGLEARLTTTEVGVGPATTSMTV